MFFIFDADMKVCDFVGSDIPGDLVGVSHPYQNARLKNPKNFSYERREESTACCEKREEADTYYAGGFIGGKSSCFIKMSEVIKENIDRDFKAGIIALWHDESHLNRYFIDNPPDITLNDTYCFPEEKEGGDI